MRSKPCKINHNNKHILFKVVYFVIVIDKGWAMYPGQACDSGGHVLRFKRAHMGMCPVPTCNCKKNVPNFEINKVFKVASLLKLL